VTDTCVYEYTYQLNERYFSVKLCRRPSANRVAPKSRTPCFNRWSSCSASFTYAHIKTKPFSPRRHTFPCS